MKCFLKSLSFFVLISISTLLLGQEEEIYLFSYFKDNGQDGLHLAYSHDGFVWKSLNDDKSFLQPQIGKDKLMRDPCIISGPDSLFYMVWTTGWWDKHIGFATSKDLITWSEQKSIPVMEHEPDARNSWAPEIFYDDKEKEFLIFWATTIPGRHSEVATSEREKGLNHRIYYTRTKDFRKLDNTKLFFNPSFSVIDATIIKIKNIYYMVLKNENSNPPEKNLRITKSNKAGGPYPVEVSSPITGDYWAEGPTTLYIDGYLYVYFDKYRDHKYGAVRSKDMVNWEDISDEVSFPEGIRHGTAFKASRKVLDKIVKTDL